MIATQRVSGGGAASPASPPRRRVPSSIPANVNYALGLRADAHMVRHSATLVQATYAESPEVHVVSIDASRILLRIATDAEDAVRFGARVAVQWRLAQFFDRHVAGSDGLPWSESSVPVDPLPQSELAKADAAYMKEVAEFKLTLKEKREFEPSWTAQKHYDSCYGPHGPRHEMRDDYDPVLPRIFPQTCVEAPIEGLRPGMTYQIRVARVMPHGISPFSKIIEVPTSAGVPWTPSPPVVATLTATSAVLVFDGELEPAIPAPVITAPAAKSVVGRPAPGPGATLAIDGSRPPSRQTDRDVDSTIATMHDNLTHLAHAEISTPAKSATNPRGNSGRPPLAGSAAAAARGRGQNQRPVTPANDDGSATNTTVVEYYSVASPLKRGTSPGPGRGDSRPGTSQSVGLMSAASEAAVANEGAMSIEAENAAIDAMILAQDALPPPTLSRPHFQCAVALTPTAMLALPPRRARTVRCAAALDPDADEASSVPAQAYDLGVRGVFWASPNPLDDVIRARQTFKHAEFYGLVEHTTYFCRVRCMSSDGLFGPWSDVLEFATRDAVPAAFPIEVISPTFDSLVVRRRNDVDTLSGADGSLKMAVPGSSPANLPPGEKSYEQMEEEARQKIDAVILGGASARREGVDMRWRPIEGMHHSVLKCKVPQDAAQADHMLLTARIRRFYLQYCPEKLDKASEFAQRYIDQPERLFSVLIKKYGEEPEDMSDESPDDVFRGAGAAQMAAFGLLALDTLPDDDDDDGYGNKVQRTSNPGQAAGFDDTDVHGDDEDEEPSKKKILETTDPVDCEDGMPSWRSERQSPVPLTAKGLRFIGDATASRSMRRVEARQAIAATLRCHLAEVLAGYGSPNGQFSDEDSFRGARLVDLDPGTQYACVVYSENRNAELSAVRTAWAATTLLPEVSAARCATAQSTSVALEFPCVVKPSTGQPLNGVEYIVYRTTQLKPVLPGDVIDSAAMIRCAKVAANDAELAPAPFIRTTIGMLAPNTEYGFAVVPRVVPPPPAVWTPAGQSELIRERLEKEAHRLIDIRPKMITIVSRTADAAPAAPQRGSVVETREGATFEDIRVKIAASFVPNGKPLEQAKVKLYFQRVQQWSTDAVPGVQGLYDTDNAVTHHVVESKLPCMRDSRGDDPFVTADRLLHSTETDAEDHTQLDVTHALMKLVMQSEAYDAIHQETVIAASNRHKWRPVPKEEWLARWRAWRQQLGMYPTPARRQLPPAPDTESIDGQRSPQRLYQTGTGADMINVSAISVHLDDRTPRDGDTRAPSARDKYAVDYSRNDDGDVVNDSFQQQPSVSNPRERDLPRAMSPSALEGERTMTSIAGQTPGRFAGSNMSASSVAFGGAMVPTGEVSDQKGTVRIGVVVDAVVQARNAVGWGPTNTFALTLPYDVPL